MKPATTPPHRATLILLTGVSVLSLNMFLPSLTSISVTFSTDYSVINLSISGYLAATAFVHLIAGPMSDRYGRRPIILGALVLYFIASVACSLSQDPLIFLIFRLLQAGVVSGATLSMAVVRDTHSRKGSASELGYIAMAMALAPLIGPMIGGAMDNLFGWRSIFYFYAASGAILSVLCWFDLGETRRPTFRNASETKSPGLLSDSRFLAYSSCTAFSTGVFFTFISGAPLVGTRYYDLNSAQIGMVVGSITAGFMAGSFCAGRFGTLVGLNRMLIAGRWVACVGLLTGFAFWSFGWDGPVFIFGATAFAGFANGLTMPSSNSGAMSVRPGEAGRAAGLNAAFTVACGAALTMIVGFAVDAAPSPSTLLLLMSVPAAAGLCSAYAARKLERMHSEKGNS